MSWIEDQIDVYRDRVVMSKEIYDLILHRVGLQNKVINGLRYRTDEYDQLLRTALHDLALKEEKEPLHFTRQWIRNHRHVPPEVPLNGSQKEGGEAQNERS